MRKMVTTGMPKVMQNHQTTMPWATLGRFFNQKLTERIAKVIFDTKTRPATNSTTTRWLKGSPI
jgi:hypothetical protein